MLKLISGLGISSETLNANEHEREDTLISVIEEKIYLAGVSKKSNLVYDMH